MRLPTLMAWATQCHSGLSVVCCSMELYLLPRLTQGQRKWVKVEKVMVCLLLRTWTYRNALQCLSLQSFFLPSLPLFLQKWSLPAPWSVSTFISSFSILRGLRPVSPQFSHLRKTNQPSEVIPFSKLHSLPGFLRLFLTQSSGSPSEPPQGSWDPHFRWGQSMAPSHLQDGLLILLSGTGPSSSQFLNSWPVVECKSERVGWPMVWDTMSSLPILVSLFSLAG